jgi:hypothetical protein
VAASIQTGTDSDSNLVNQKTLVMRQKSKSAITGQ